MDAAERRRRVIPGRQDVVVAGETALTATEWHVLGLLAQSLPAEDVAERLHVAVEMVRLWRSTALAKLAISEAGEAVALRRALEGASGEIQDGV